MYSDFKRIFGLNKKLSKFDAILKFILIYQNCFPFPNTCCRAFRVSLITQSFHGVTIDKFSIDNHRYRHTFSRLDFI